MTTILHALWLPSGSVTSRNALAVWAETDTARRLKAAFDHPYAASASAIIHSLWNVARDLPMNKLMETASKLALVLPSDDRRPLRSTAEVAVTTETARPTRRKIRELTLRPWRVEAVMVPPHQALPLLLRLPDSSSYLQFGPSVKFWQRAARLAAMVLVRGQYLPAADEAGNGRWRVMLAEAGLAESVVTLARAMPASARALARPLPEPLELLHDFLAAAVHDYAAHNYTPGQSPFHDPRKWQPKPTPSSPRDFWWLDLWPHARHNLSTLKREPEQAEFGEAVRSWSLKAYEYVASPYRVAFRLEPPQNSEAVENAEWRLTFHLQPKTLRMQAQPSFAPVPVDSTAMEPAPTEAPALWAAAEVWAEPPQPEMPDLLRAGLAQAAGLYPPLSRLGDTHESEFLSLIVAEAVEFLEKYAETLSARGFGVLVPTWWKERQRRLKLQLSLGQREGSGLLGMNALVDFDWKIAVGDTSLTLDELTELAQSKTALVQVRGEWMQFNPDEVQAALKLVQRHKKNHGKLALGEALNLALANPSEWDGLDVESVQVDGWLDDLIGQLNGHRTLEKLPQAASFVGQLRPYQLNGYSWLNFLRQYGFGACLADDMGLGKCVLPGTRVWTNGTSTPIEQIWNEFATDEQAEGEEVWALPKAAIWVNAIDEITGRIVLARVRRLYRQHVAETIKCVTLEDGSQISLTHSHKLLTRDGWRNDFKIGDWVCVPSKLKWPGESVDHDLVELLAWQIAEGYEQSKRSAVSISQKDTARLDALRRVLERVGQRYKLKINQPAIRQFRDKVPCLTVNSRDYQNFLRQLGYEWGKLSAQKSIPDFIQRGDIESLRLFLRHFFEAEGAALVGMRSVEISSASHTLMSQLATLLRRFGIWLRVSAKQKRATNGSRKYREYYIGVLGGNSIRRFQQEIGFLSERKQARLNEICAFQTNTNVEGIPASDILANAAATTGLPVRHFGVPSNVYTQGTQQFSRASLERAALGVERILSGQAEQQYRGKPKSKWTTQTLLAYEQLDRSSLLNTQKQLRQILDREVFYCKVKSIEEFHYDGWVYDLEVEQHHNFVANNILCHNTIQMLALLTQDHDAGALTQPILLVCPTTVVNNWVREAANFAPQLKCYAHHGPGRLRGEAFAKGVADYHLVITSYALLPRDREFIESVAWGGVVLDEAHNIKNPVTKQAQIVRKLNAGYRVALTGTPLENRLQDLWSIMHFLNPGYLGSAEAFQRNFAGAIERWQDEATATRLRALTGPFILRRLKTDKAIIQDLPEKNEMKEFCGLTKEQAALYRSVTQEALRQIAASDGIQRRGIILATLTKLKQVCNHPRHLLGDKSALKHRSGKLNRLTEMLEQALAEDDRVLIFTQYAEMGGLLHEHLTSTFGEALYLYGGTPAPKRAQMIDQFQDGGPRLFVLSLKAGGAGINLTRANRVFHYDRWWNPAVENQATDRAFRIGQTQRVQVHKMICRGTLEERIDELITRKLALADQIVGSGEHWLTELSTDDLRDLLLLRKEAVDD